MTTATTICTIAGALDTSRSIEAPGAYTAPGSPLDATARLNRRAAAPGAEKWRTER